MLSQALVLALLVNGRTVFEDFSWTDKSKDFALALEEFGLKYEQQGHQLALEGVGFQFTPPTLLPIRFTDYENVMLWTLASKDTETLFTIAGNNDEDGSALVQRAKSLLLQYFVVKPCVDEPSKFAFTFAAEDPKFKKDSLGNVFPIYRDRLLLRTLLKGGSLVLDERSSVKDSWPKMLAYFGVSLQTEIRGMEQLSEFERRMMMARGQKLERSYHTEMEETKVLTSRDYYIPGDATEATAFALWATLGKHPKDFELRIKNANVNSTRTGAITALKRMGADIDVASRREKFGDAFGDLVVVPLETGRRLQGRRFSEDVIATCLEEYPFLAVAACFAEGETILRLPREFREIMRPKNELLAENLRKTGAEVGVYEDGLVIRGLEVMLDGSDFDGGENPNMGIALRILAMILEDDSAANHQEVMDREYPLLCSKLQQVAEQSIAEAQAAVEALKKAGG